MELLSVLATCAALSFGSGSPIESTYPYTEKECRTASLEYKTLLQKVKLSEQDRDAIARVTYAEAANQGDAGLAGVVYTILNRLISGEFGSSVASVVNAPKQFEPVTRVGGSWEQLPKISAAARSKVETIINLALDGHLPDITNGALFFQNPTIVASREKAGEVSKGLTHFGGAKPSAVINDHSFYPAINSAPSAERNAVRLAAVAPQKAKAWDVYEKSREQVSKSQASWDVFAQNSTSAGVFDEGQQP